MVWNCVAVIVVGVASTLIRSYPGVYLYLYFLGFFLASWIVHLHLHLVWKIFNHRLFEYHLYSLLSFIFFSNFDLFVF